MPEETKQLTPSEALVVAAIDEELNHYRDNGIDVDSLME